MQQKKAIKGKEPEQSVYRLAESDQMQGNPMLPRQGPEEDHATHGTDIDALQPGQFENEVGPSREISKGRHDALEYVFIQWLRPHPDDYRLTMPISGHRKRTAHTIQQNQIRAPSRSIIHAES